MTVTAAVSAMQVCPRWTKCSANICPLDQDWRQRSHAIGEPVCGLAQEAVKPGAEGRLAPYVRQEVIAEVRRVFPEMMSRSYVIRRALQRAATSGSRLDRLPKKETAAALGRVAAEGSNNKLRPQDTATARTSQRRRHEETA